jgi:hypothetical protein
MSEENKIEEPQRGSRGEVGAGTASTRLKSSWRKNGKPGETLKQFVCRMIKEGKNPAAADAKHWQEAKLGKFEEKRSEKNVARIQLEKQASRSKKK